MVFMCTLCNAITPGKGRRVIGKLTLKANQLEAVQYLLGRALEPMAAPHVAALKEGDALCHQCFPENLRSQITRRQGPGGEILVGESLVGQQTASWVAGGAGMRLGKVTDQDGGVCTDVDRPAADGYRDALGRDDQGLLQAWRLHPGVQG